MNKITYSLIIIGIAVFQNARLFAQNNGKPGTQLEAYIKKFSSAYGTLLRNKKTDALGAYYDSDIRLMPVFQKTVMGKRNAMAYYNALLERFIITSYQRNDLEILDLGNELCVMGTFTMNVILQSSGVGYDASGKYINLWKKSPNGNPLLITEAWNFDQKLEIEPLLRFDNVPVVDVALQAHVPINNNISFELAALNTLMEATVSHHDADLWTQFYADDAVLLSQRRSMHKGEKAIHEYVEMHVKELPIFDKLNIRNDRIDDLGKYVIEYASHIAIIRNGDFSAVSTGKDLAIWRREPNGSLKIFRHIGMYD